MIQKYGPNIVAIFVILVVATFCVSQWSAFLSLDATSRASWVQAVGTILAIVASTAVALWIDQGTSKRLQNERAAKIDHARRSIAKVISDAADAIETAAPQISEKQFHPRDFEKLLTGVTTSRAVLAKLLEQKLEVIHVDVIVRAHKAMDLFLDQLGPSGERRRHPVNGGIGITKEVLADAKETTAILRAITVP